MHPKQPFTLCTALSLPKAPCGTQPRALLPLSIALTHITLQQSYLYSIYQVWPLKFGQKQKLVNSKLKASVFIAWDERQPNQTVFIEGQNVLLREQEEYGQQVKGG